MTRRGGWKLWDWWVADSWQRDRQSCHGGCHGAIHCRQPQETEKVQNIARTVSKWPNGLVIRKSCFSYIRDSYLTCFLCLSCLFFLAGLFLCLSSVLYLAGSLSCLLCLSCLSCFSCFSWIVANCKIFFHNRIKSGIYVVFFAYWSGEFLWLIHIG